MSVKGRAHIAFKREIIQKPSKFYTQAPGFNIGHRWTLPSFQIREAAMLGSPDRRTCIEVFDHEAVIPAQGRKAESEDEVAYGALLHLALYVEDVEEMYQKALVYGAKVCIHPEQLYLGEPPLVVKNALVYSPNGEVIEFIEEVDFNRSA
ncbi:hypothetical protein EDC32_1011364 [Laceyella sacchari]|uniref:VOC family protein n=1 Tax=Laceyella sacchari TaxID=37482 RepID=UPI0010454D0B|nr:VOC family protein [Laceyella sacchari]TCW41697.1 hypothetical protein EDC32_1011364 [Laceyella sacchari]